MATPLLGTETGLKGNYEQLSQQSYPESGWSSVLRTEEHTSRLAPIGILGIDRRQLSYYRVDELSVELFSVTRRTQKSLLAGFIDARVLRVSEPSALALLLLGLFVLMIKKSLKSRKQTHS